MGQKTSGILMAKKLGYMDEEILVISDEGVSARKNKLHDRSGMNKILKQIRFGEIRHLIVYEPDRLARKMVEHLKVIEELKKYNVSLVYSSDGRVFDPDQYSLEATFALHAEIEGNKIIQRANDVRKFYPNELLGYKIVGTKGEKRYEQKNDSEFLLIKQLFFEFKSINSLEEYNNLKNSWKLKIKAKHIQKILVNSFYAGVLIDGDRSIPLSHIIGIVKVEVILENRRKFNQWGLDKVKPQKNKLFELMDVSVYCNICGREIDQKLIKGVYKFSCNHGNQGDKNRLSVNADLVFDIIPKCLSELCTALDPKLIEANTIKVLHNYMKGYTKDENELLKRIRCLEKEALSKLHDIKVLTGLLEKVDSLYQKLRVNRSMQLEIQLKLSDIKTLLNEKYYEDVQRHLMFYLIPTGLLLLDSVKLDNEVIHVYHNLAEAVKGGD
jgi:DNA invertase Pin-like site-specific DNA recombinase